MPKQTTSISPQEGPQTAFMESSADIVLYGGGAGGGKTFAILLECLRHSNNKAFGAVVFRRTTPQITNEGALWDESENIFPLVGAKPQRHILQWRFPSGAKVKFSHLEHEKNIHDYQGSQIPLIIFDELTHFTEKQFTYMMSRNRSSCGVRPYIRATCNPDSDSWVRKLIDWWIGSDGLPIKERSGVIRYFIKEDGRFIWEGSKAELIDKYGVTKNDIKSFTFIPSSVLDNKKLLEVNPEYLGSLRALDAVERGRLLDGNWNVRPSSGMYFKREYFKVAETVPKMVSIWRAWDLASTEEGEGNDPDYTSGVKMGKSEEGDYYILDVIQKRYSPMKVRKLMLSTAEMDGKQCSIFVPQDPGQAGKDQAQQIVKMLAGYKVYTGRPTGDKVTRASAFSAQAEAGNCYILRAEWNGIYLSELENFPDGKHDDMVDASADAFNKNVKPKRSFICV